MATPRACPDTILRILPLFCGFLQSFVVFATLSKGLATEKGRGATAYVT